MSNPLEDERYDTPRRVPPVVANTVRAVRIDLSWLHAVWMSLAYAEGFRGDYSVIEHREPATPLQRVGYRLWSLVGALCLVVVYPLFIVGLATRFYARRIDRITAGLGVVGVVGVSVLVWGALTALTYLSAIAFEGFLAVAVAGVVATVSAVLALYFTRSEHRVVTVALGYPFAVTALFLPPVVASLYSPTLAAVVFPSSTSLAIWILDNLLAVGGLNAFIRASFELQGLAYVVMWFFLAVPVGWALGGLSTLATVARQSNVSSRRR